MLKVCAQICKRTIQLVPFVLILAFITGFIGPGVAKADPGWHHSDWDYRKQITINSSNISGSANLTNFPVLISIVDSDLITKALSSGDDIIFTTGDEVTQLSHEIESFDVSTGNLTAWVRIPSLSATADTNIYMYYGNSSATNSENATDVWNVNYMMVQHLEETSGGANAITDSTANSNNGTDINNPTFGAIGQLDGAISYNSTSQQYINCGDKSDLEFATGVDFTIEAWIMTSSTGVRKGIVGKRSGGVDNWAGYEIEIVDTNIIRARLRQTGGADVDTVSSSTVTDGNWHYIVFVADRDGNGQIYIDGSADGSAVDISGQNGNLVNSDDFWIARDAASGYFDGTIDEVRISNTVRGANWIKTSYNNQNNPGDFLTFGPEIGKSTVTTNATTLVTETTANISGTLNDDGGEACEYSFEWGTAPGSYSANISWTGSITSGQTFSENITSLNKGDVYYYRARAMNNAGIDNGSEKSFLTKPDGPSDFTATTASSSKINLSWTKGVGAVRTMVRGKQGSYPANRTDGYQVYFGTDVSASDTSLLPSTTYYYRAWSEVTSGALQQYSVYFDAGNATTTSGAPTAVGGIVLKVNKALVLAPWLIIALITSFVLFRIILYVRKRVRYRKSLH